MALVIVASFSGAAEQPLEPTALSPRLFRMNPASVVADFASTCPWFDGLWLTGFVLGLHSCVLWLPMVINSMIFSNS